MTIETHDACAGCWRKAAGLPHKKDRSGAVRPHGQGRRPQSGVAAVWKRPLTRPPSSGTLSPRSPCDDSNLAPSAAEAAGALIENASLVARFKPCPDANSQFHTDSPRRGLKARRWRIYRPLAAEKARRARTKGSFFTGPKRASDARKEVARFVLHYEAKNQGFGVKIEAAFDSHPI